jgi:pimeloyl-ACP methyl ester carboxylesterase
MRAFDHQTGKHFEAEGAHLYVEESGRPDGVPLVALHGGLGSVEDFAALLPRLKERFRVIGLDSRGHGKSTLGGERLSYARLERDVQIVLDQLHLERFCLLGFSDGGIVGYRLAARDSARIHKMVTIGSQWEMKPDDPVRRILQGVTPERWRIKFPATYELYQSVNPAPDFDRLVRSVVPMWLDLEESGYPGERVKSISCDVLAIRGDDDHLVSREEVFGFCRNVKQAKWFNVPFAGHAAHEDQPELVALGIERFFDGIE